MCPWLLFEVMEGWDELSDFRVCLGARALVAAVRGLV